MDDYGVWSRCGCNTFALRPGRHHRKRPPEPALPPRQDDTFDLPDVIDLPEDKRPPELVGGIYEDDPPEVPGDDEEFEASDAAKKVQPIRPNYNLRRVLQKLPQLVAAGDITKAKWLLLGLHERLWHSPINDYLNLLRRCGMDSDVLEVAREAVQECSICRKFTRLPHRPQTRVGGAIAFGDAIQIDIFHLQDTLYLLMIDEATRYKMCQVLPGQDSEQIMEVLLKPWIYLFGPPTKIIMDQQVSLMSHESAVEFERLNITRVPKGTTSGHAAAQHTGTGLVERHVDLIKLTMLKLQAEMTRQGLTLEDSEISGEAAMAHNLTLNYGGVTPAMCVFGTLPRGFYESDGRGIMSATGALQTDLSTFERALRIRQAALAQCHQAIIEDRVARAARSRPRQLEAHDLVAGIIEKYKVNLVDGEDQLFFYDWTRKKARQSSNIKDDPTWFPFVIYDLTEEFSWWRLKRLLWNIPYFDSWSMWSSYHSTRCTMLAGYCRRTGNGHMFPRTPLQSWK